MFDDYDGITADFLEREREARERERIERKIDEMNEVLQESLYYKQMYFEEKQRRVELENQIQRLLDKYGSM